MEDTISQDVSELDQSTDASSTFPFLNHSTSTIPLNLPPSVDDKPLARQRRKRTCPEDQTVLEQAFRRDPKPDKAARLKLVEQVSLGEKEVQIWFQNRRQSSRRKSRPLLPHEVAQYQLSRATSALMESENAPHAVEASDMSVSALLDDDVAAVDSGALVSREAQSIDSALSIEPPALADISDVSSVLDANFQSASAAVGYLANRRSAESLLSSSIASSLDPSQRPARDRPLRKALSCVRLSMTAEGKAEVITKNGASPSPPRRAQGPQMSALPKMQPVPFKMTPLSVQKVQKSSIGRSRDSRSWEFWCDKDSRAEFENTAEKDGSGSAAGAIGLLRSASGRSILGALPAKRNFQGTSRPLPSKRSKLELRRPPLQRSNTSLGRLQNTIIPDDDDAYLNKTAKLKHSESASYAHSPGNESNKENRSPDWRMSIRGDSPLFQSLSEVLPDEEATTSKSRQRECLSHPPGKKMSTKDGSLNDSQPDAEVEIFMQGHRRSASASEEDDLDCIQGLLSLSQGNWK